MRYRIIHRYHCKRKRNEQMTYKQLLEEFINSEEIVSIDDYGDSRASDNAYTGFKRVVDQYGWPIKIHKNNNLIILIKDNKK